MANLTFANGFSPVSPSPRAVRVVLAATQTFVKGDALYLNSAGNAATTEASATCIGIAAAGPMDGTTNLPKTTSAGTAVDYAIVYPADLEFEGQISTGSLTDPFTSITSGSCFDIAGSSGAQYIDAGASTYDMVRITGNSFEPNSGQRSQYGAYQKVTFKINVPVPMNDTLITGVIL